MTANGDKSSPAERVCVGAVAGARGLKGEVRIKSFTAEPDGVAAYGPVSTETGEREFEVRVVARVKGLVIARLSGIGDRDAAEALKGTRLYVPRRALPEPEDGSYYHADLVGLRAETETGETLGRVKAVHNFGAGDVIEIGAEGKSTKDGMMLPFTTAVVPEVDLDAGRLVIRPPAELDAEENEDVENG